ncbi:MAG: ABC transporter permease [Solirubrobacterales bacterium]|nr:ABC transporter permease [Solirubrobacterales bacterium]
MSGLVASYVLVVFLLLTLNFALPRALPGEPIAALGDPTSSTYVGDPERRAAVRRYYDLDRSALDGYRRYLRDLARGELGTSIRSNRPVARELADRLPWTLLLVGTALALATAAGMLAGTHSGWRRERSTDRSLLVLVLSVQSIPVFFLASAAVYVFAVQLGWFPLSGARTPFDGSSGVAAEIADVAHHLVLPAVVMALPFVGLQYLVMRAGVVSELGADHLLLGRAKGLSERTLKYRYAARNALAPSVTVAALQVGSAITAAIFVESVFAYPGVGRLLFESVADRDYPLMQGSFLVLTLLVVGANLLADLAYRRLDPRTVA